jgi:hypothetical protein
MYQNARQAEYVIENEGNTLRVRVDQRFGGRWVLLNNLPVELRGGRNYEISVTNFSPEDVAAGSQRVIADAIRIVSADGTDQRGLLHACGRQGARARRQQHRHALGGGVRRAERRGVRH